MPIFIVCPNKWERTDKGLEVSAWDILWKIWVIFQPIQQSSLPQAFNSIMDLERSRNDKDHTKFYEVVWIQVIWTIEDHSLFFMHQSIEHLSSFKYLMVEEYVVVV